MNALNLDMNGRRWTEDENMRFIALRTDGVDMTDIPAHLPGRTYHACRYQWDYVLTLRLEQEPSISLALNKADSDWTLEQDTKIVQLVGDGHLLRDMQDCFPGHGIIVLATRYYKLWKQLNQQGANPPERGSAELGSSESRLQKPSNQIPELTAEDLTLLQKRPRRKWTDNANRRLLMLRANGLTFPEMPGFMGGVSARDCSVHYYTSRSMLALRGLLVPQAVSASDSQAADNAQRQPPADSQPPSSSQTDGAAKSQPGDMAGPCEL